MDMDDVAQTVVVRARIVTTHAIPAYGGIRFSQAALEQFADALASGAVPMRYNHDLERQAVSRTIAAGIETLDDGELAVWADLEVDKEGWEEFERERMAAGAPGGFSISTTETFGARGEAPFPIQIAADASHFDQETLIEAAEASLPDDMPFELAWLFQFSWTPDPKAVIDIAQTMLVSIPPNLLSSYLYDLVNRIRAKRAARGEKTTFEFRVNRTLRTKTTLVKIESASADDFRLALATLPELLRAEGETAVWHSPDRQWRPIGRQRDATDLGA